VVTLFVFLSFGSFIYKGHYVFAQSDQTASKLQAANNAIEQAFNNVSDAEKAGANVSSLLAQLNVAAGILAQAENSYRTGDFTTAAVQAESILPIAQGITNSAQHDRQSALVSGEHAFWLTIAFSVIGALVFVFILFLVWGRFKRGYLEKLPYLKPEVAENTV
jgi:hypothetical protein